MNRINPNRAVNFRRPLAYFGKAAGLLFAFTLASSLATAAIQDAEHDLSTSIGQPPLVVKWKPACSLKDTTPYFEVSIFTDGSVKYLGGPQAREIGERTEQIGASNARRLIEEARHFVTGNTGPLTKRSERSLLDESYCLEVSVKNKTTIVTKRGRNDVRQTQALISTLDKTVHEKKWVCPSRDGVSAPIELRLGLSYCQDVPIASVYIADPTTCASGHQVRVYADGTVHYVGTVIHVNQRRLVLPDEYLNEQYYFLRNSDFDRMIKLMNGFELTPSPTCTGVLKNEDCSKSRSPKGFSSNSETSANNLKEFLSGAVTLRWAEFPTDRQQCPSSKPHSSSIYLDSKYVSQNKNTPTLVPELGRWKMEWQGDQVRYRDKSSLSEDGSRFRKVATSRKVAIR